MNSKSLLLIFDETSGVNQQVTVGCATDDRVAAKPATAKRNLTCWYKEAAIFKGDMLDYDDRVLLT